ncbi:MAG: hypothetical protein GXO74_01180 [Calditrichaeota bacterium]|nr:hypothetical protein [Calditrichota bacterium]
MRTKGFLLLGILFLIVVGCATTKKSTTVLMPKTVNELPYVPVGVDTSVAINARSRAAKLFSAYKSKKEADSIYTNTKDYVEIVYELYSKLEMKKDSLKLLRLKAKNLEDKIKSKKSVVLEERNQLKKLFKKIENDSATIEITLSLLEYYLFDVQNKLEHAYSIDPFNLNILILSGMSENNRGRMYNDSRAYQNAIRQFNKFFSHDRGVYSAYAAISFSYHQLKKWQKAYQYARKAKEIYAITSYFDKPLKNIPEKYAKTTLPPFGDPAEYFNLLTAKGVTEVRTYQADSALATFNEALQFASSGKDSNYVESFIKNYIFWDGKNIRTAERHLEIADSLRVNNYKWAYRPLTELLPQLTTTKARHVVSWELARIEYDSLKQEEKAAKRLYAVVAEADSDKSTPNFFETPADTTYLRYFRDCGQMLLNLGRKFRGEGDIQKAHHYLSQDTTISWKGRAKAFLLMSNVIVISSNITGQERQKMFFNERLKLLLRAREFRKDLEPNEIDAVYRGIIDIYKSLGKRREAGFYFYEWNKIRKQRNGD